MTISENIKLALEHIDNAKGNIVNSHDGNAGPLMDAILALEQLAQAIDALNSKLP